jgi:hypothetical protein
MTCADVERVLPELMDGAPDGVGRTNNAAFQNAFDAHVRSCPDCSDLVSDLKLIASEAHQMAASEEPSPRVWLNVAAQLRAEGLIREQDAAPGRPILLPTFRRRGWSVWWLAPIAAVLVAAGSYVVSHKQATPVAQLQSSENPTPATSTPAVSVPATAPSPSTVAETPTARQTPSSPSSSSSSSTPAPVPADQQVARQTAATEKAGFKEESEPASDDEQFLSAVSTSAPAMRATYESQLKAVNSDIGETQAYVDRNPADADARQHLMDAYQQKALLYQIALDHIQ